MNSSWNIQSVYWTQCQSSSAEETLNVLYVLWTLVSLINPTANISWWKQTSEPFISHSIQRHSGWGPGCIYKRVFPGNWEEICFGSRRFRLQKIEVGLPHAAACRRTVTRRWKFNTRSTHWKSAMSSLKNVWSNFSYFPIVLALWVGTELEIYIM